MVFLHIFRLDFRLVNFVKLRNCLFIILAGEIKTTQVVVRLRHRSMDRIAVDERLQQVASILVVELCRANTLIEEGVRPQIVLLVIGAFIYIFKICCADPYFSLLNKSTAV